MDFERFIEELKVRIREFLPEEYQDAVIETNEMQKLNHSYQALVVKNGDQMITPTIDCTQLYREYENGTSMDAIAEQAAEVALKQPEGIDVSIFEDYEKAKDKLFIRVSDAEANAEVLKTAPHKDIKGIAITYHIMADLGDEGMGSVFVTDALMDRLGVTPEQLHMDAMENSQKLLPPQLQGMESMLGKMLGMEMGMEVPQTFAQQLDGVDLRNDVMLVLSNTHSTNGAAVMFYPEVLKAIGDKMQTNFFILPSSIHEVILVNDDGTKNYRDLEAMVREINSSEVSPKDRLSDNVYHYDHQSRVFEKASDYEARTDIETVDNWIHKHYNINNIDTLCEVADLNDALEKRAEAEGISPADYIRKYDPAPEELNDHADEDKPKSKHRKEPDWER